VMELDSRPDALALEGCCTSYAIAADAEEIVMKEGLQGKSPIFHRGQQIGVERKNNPALRIRNQAWARFLQFADRLGLSPQARQSPGAARLVVNPHVLRCFLRWSLTEVPSLHRHDAASLVIRTSPPPHTA
jgi:P27 family predicted phage terminase small subunit